MTNNSKAAVGVLSIMWITNAVADQKQFPEWRGRQTTLLGLWEATPIVVVGNLGNITQYGVQSVEGLPWPVEQEIRTLYWCQGELQIDARVKGSVRGGKQKFLWASVNPGCRLQQEGQRNSGEPRLRAWFVRKEGVNLRPTFDGGARYYLEFRTRWDEGSGVASLERFGTLLLTPRANSRTADEFEAVLWEQADVACAILGRSRCAVELKTLSGLGDNTLRSAVCQYLKAQLGEGCDR